MQCVDLPNVALEASEMISNHVVAHPTGESYASRKSGIAFQKMKIVLFVEQKFEIHASNNPEIARQ